jgi:hypothetical protein
VDVVTRWDELQVDKANRTEVDVVTCRDELHVDKAVIIREPLTKNIAMSTI